MQLGNDVECGTAQGGAGATVVLFTTRLGTPTGNPITPIIKLSTNLTRASRMPDIINHDQLRATYRTAIRRSIHSHHQPVFSVGVWRQP
jgi:altronate dehydratase